MWAHISIIIGFALIWVSVIGLGAIEGYQFLMIWKGE
jgi:hypothetical protein